MCGPTAAQTQNQSALNNFFSTLQSTFQTEFGQNEAIFNELNQSLSPIVEAGINQQGYSPSELAALNTQAIEGEGTQVASEEQAANESLAGRGGGTAFVPSGAQTQLNEEIQQGAETNLENEELGITEQSAAIGRQNYLTAVGALSGLPSVATTGLSSLANSVTGSGTAAGNEANTIASESGINPYLGILGGVASNLAGDLTFGGSSSSGSQAVDTGAPGG